MSERDGWVVCFDLGGVVVRIARDWAEGCAAAGLEVREPERFHEAAIKANRRDLADRYQRGLISCEAFFAGVASNSAGLYEAAEVERVHRSWILGEYPGVAHLVSRLNDSGVFTACLSNTNASHWRESLVGSGPDATPSDAIAALRLKMASHELGEVKPGEAIYEKAEALIGDASGVREAGRIVFFDDLAANVEAARARGWNAHRVDHTGDTAAEMAAVLRNLGLGV